MSAYNIKTDPATFATNILYLDGKPFRIDNLPFMRDILNCEAEKVCIMSGRQVGKSTVISAIALTRLLSSPYYRALYVAPRHEQLKQWVVDKFSAMVNQSPLIKKYFMDSSCADQVLLHSFLNGSAIFLRSCYNNPDGIRGLTSNLVLLDEVQDLSLEHLPVIEEVTARKADKHLYYTGTPKSSSNSLAKLFHETTQHYWSMKCESCGTWNISITRENLGADGLICKKCHARLNPINGQYVAMYPDRKFVGFHISQGLIAGVPGTGVPWSRLYEKLENPFYSKAKFDNEVLGFPADVGNQLLVLPDLQACCDETMPEFVLDRKAEWGVRQLIASCDWGVLGGNTSTVLTIGGLDRNDNIRVIYSKKYPPDEDPLSQMDDICSIIRKANVSLIVADRGGGSLANSVLRRNFPDKFVYEIEYKARVQAGMKFNNDSRSWITDRTRAIAGLVLDIKSKKIIFPRFSYWEERFAPDLLTLSCEYNDKTRAFQITHEDGTTDDFAHTLVYLRLGARFFLPHPHRAEHQLEEFQPPDAVKKEVESSPPQGSFDIEEEH